METVRKLRQHIGRRGAILALFGFVWVMFGYSLLTVPPALIAAAHLLGIGLETWAWVWVATGAVSLLFSIRPAGRDAIGYAACVFMPCIWALGYLQMWISGSGFDPRAWISFLVWAAVTGVTAVVAGWKEPE